VRQAAGKGQNEIQTKFSYEYGVIIIYDVTGH